MQFVLVVCAIFQIDVISFTSAINIPGRPSPGAAIIQGKHDLNPSNSLEQTNFSGAIWKKYQSVLSQERSALDKGHHTHVLKDCNTEAGHLGNLAAGKEINNLPGLMEVQVEESTEAQTLPMKGLLKRSLTSSHQRTSTNAEMSHVITDNKAINSKKHLLEGTSVCASSAILI